MILEGDSFRKGTKLTLKGDQWIDFSADTLAHIEEYVVPQYGDFPDEMIEGFSVDDIRKQIDRYLKRVGKNSRGQREDERDCLKIAHYACFLHNRIKKGEQNKFKKGE